MVHAHSTYSVICTKTLLAEVLPLFQIEQPLECEFWCQGLNDSYKVTTTTDTFLLRIYRHNWRTLENIRFELDALLHLQENDADIAYPVKTHKDDYIVTIEAAEGSRYAILTRYIAGKELDFSIADSATLYGKNIAQLHLKSEQFTSQYQRSRLDVNHLITKPLQRIKPFLSDRQDDWLFIQSYSLALAKQLREALARSQDTGLCHGDLHGGNAHQYRQQLAFFDFDCCGIGLRCYDLAVFKWSLQTNKREPTIWQRFIASYLQHRPLDGKDIALIDMLVSVRHIWLIGVHIDVAIAKGWLDENYFNEKIAFLREQQRQQSRDDYHE